MNAEPANAKARTTEKMCRVHMEAEQCQTPTDMAVVQSAGEPLDV